MTEIIPIAQRLPALHPLRPTGGGCAGLILLIALAAPAPGQSVYVGTSPQVSASSQCTPVSTNSASPCKLTLVQPLPISATSTNILDLSATWNSASQFWGVMENITNTLSAGNSLFLDLQNASTSVMHVDPNGVLTASQLTIGSPLALTPALTYVSGGTACAGGAQVITFIGGGGVGALGSINTASGGSPSGTVTMTAGGYGYTSTPTTGKVATCTGNSTFSGGQLAGYVLSALQGASPGSAAANHLQMYADSSTLLFTAVDTSGNISTMLPRGASGLPLLGQGTGAAPAYGALNLAGSGTVTGALPNTNLPAQVQWTWNDQTASVTAAVQNGYVNDGGSTSLTYTLPTTCSIGDRFRVVGKGPGGWTITANTGQTIHFGSVDSNLSGSLSSTQQYDSVELLNITACTDWVVTSAVGNLTVN